MSRLFSSLTLRDTTFRNRLWVAPMCQYSAVDGYAAEWHHVHLAQFASGGAGLVVTEATAVSSEGRISPEDTGIWDDARADAWRPIVDALHRRGAVAGIQLAHAGRKASTWSPFSGERGTVPADRGGWTTVAPSAVAFDGYATPRPLDADGIERVVADFAAAARRAVDVGFDVLEVHAAHGYLLHQFLSPLSNLRDDAYGGTLENRMRLLVRVVAAVREAAPAAVVFVRLSATDWAEGGWDVDDTVAASRAVRDAGADLIDVSSGGLVAHQRITTGPAYQAGFAARVRAEADVPVNAVGMIDDARLAEHLVASDQVDAVMAAREWLRDPHFALRAAGELGADAPWPPQYERARRR
ncbi:NADH:flavin oxidoreductase/NADH oxidase [Microbacterium sp. 10M-3C3]|jgi:2,4-dienoyl-CoA reductase-like NADH-dependent reductase (Old Yellow Enzyme family)|uniref:NADH:flavin oxidoreductase/NADH oxidase n=1 Tax=Microbacterium sp. 10M-3C3 TaxID=2483401 RepID=UPI000F644D30|nr:NADH:flavin oxidoreductase/NADH oxidase [Microbacterium sp. 10M-3C3]